MLSERKPHNTDSDSYIRQYAVDHNLHLQAVTCIHLLSNCRDMPNTASINWLLPGQPVTRYRKEIK